MTVAYGGCILEPNGQSVKVTITTQPSNVVANVFVDNLGATPRANPFYISTRTTVFLTVGIYKVSMLLAGRELCGTVVVVEDAQVATATATLAASVVQVGPTNYPVSTIGGISANGLYDDQSIQRTINFAAGITTSGTVPATSFGGTVYVDVPVQLPATAVAVKFPAKGNWTIRGVAEAPADFNIVDGGIIQGSSYIIGDPVPGSITVVTNSNQVGSNPGGQLPTGATCLFDATTGPSTVILSVSIENLLFYQPISAFFCVYALAFNSSLGDVDFVNCVTNSVNGVIQAAQGFGQPRRMTIANNAIFGQVCQLSGGAFATIIHDNFISETKSDNLKPYTAGVVGTVVHSESFPAQQVHHNFITSNVDNASVNAATICYRNISQTEDGLVDHNVFYGAQGMCFYYQNSHAIQTQPETAGQIITGNEFVGWNLSNFTTGPGQNGSAVVIDSGSTSQMLTIGKNIWQGSAFGGTDFSKRALELVANPDTGNVVFDREQLIRNGQSMVAAYRINGTDFGTTFPSFRFHAQPTAPAFPTSGSPLTNPFGFDCSVDIVGLTALSIDGVAQGNFNGQFNIPRGSTITPTYAGGQAWKWRAA